MSSFGLLAPLAQAQDAPTAVVAPSPLVTTPPAAPPAVQYRAYPQQARRERSYYDGPPLLLGRRTAVGGYGGLTAAYTNMLNRDGGLLGFEGALLLAHKLSLGFAAYGFTRDPAGPPALDGSKRDFGTGYGGLVVRYAPFTNWPVYPAIGMLIGGGAVVLHQDDFEHNHHDDDHGEVDGYFVAQPELTVHANLTRWMRVGANVGYRITSGVSHFDLEESDLNGVVLGGHVQFGWI
ncbi:MAG TPA: hypothetical protein VFX59_16355 [Polyangiales bacterium]|nr:hypothetical protein [Polyangiales bacterium]